MPKKMIYIDDSEPVGTLEPSFPSRDVTIKRNVDANNLYELISEIGRGKFGTVYKCREKSTSLELAAKFVPIPKREDRRNVEREVEIMNSLQHPLIIQLYAAYEYQKMMCVVLELIEGGELFDRVVDDDFVLTERVCAVFMRQVCEAMQFIHRNNILHLDLKPENILCITKEGNRIKIIDFGLARKYDPDKKLQILFGTPEFVAPEVVNFDIISYSTDMWSVGVICYVLLSGLSPFMGETDIETMANVTIAKYDFDDEAFNNVSQEALDFISKLLIKDMSSRMTASECLEHKWLERRPISAPPLSQVNQPQTITKQTPALIQQQQQQQLIPKYTKTPPTPPPTTPEQPSLLPQTTPATAAAASLEGPKTISAIDTTVTTTTTTEITKPPRSIQQQESTTQKEKSLEQTKDNLKTFIERWEEHPNSPYVFDTGSNLIAQIHPGSNSTKGSSNVSSRACSPSPCGSIYSTSEDNNNFDNSNIKDEKILIKNNEKLQINDNNLENTTTNIKEYLQSFDRRNSDTNYILGKRSSNEKMNLAEEIRKLSDHLLMLAEINTKLDNDNNNENERRIKNEQQQQRKISTTDKLETIQESTGRITPTPTTQSTKKISELLKPQMKTTSKKSTSVIESQSSKDNVVSTTKKKSTMTTTKSKKISSLSFRLQQSFDQDEPPFISNGDDIEQQQQDTGYKLKNQNIEERTAKLINGFKQQLISQSSTTSLPSLPSSPSSPSSTTTTTTTADNLASSVPWTVTNKRTKFRINQMSRDVPIGSPDTHQPIDLEDAANTTKDCLLHLLEKYNERKWRNGPIGRHQSISVDWNVSENLEYQSMSSINAFFRKHSTKGNYVKQLQAQLEAKSKK